MRSYGSTWKTDDFNDTKAKRGDELLVISMYEKRTKGSPTGETICDIISIYVHRFCGGDQKKALNELLFKYNLGYLVADLEKDFKKNNIRQKDNTSSVSSISYEKDGGDSITVNIGNDVCDNAGAGDGSGGAKDDDNTDKYG